MDMSFLFRLFTNKSVNFELDQSFLFKKIALNLSMD